MAILRTYLLIPLAALVFAAAAPAQVPNLNAVQMVDGSTGYIGGTGGAIYKTTNGGSAWFRLTSTTSRTLYDVFFLNSSTGSVTGGESFVSGNVISRTMNGGQSWANQPPGVSTLLSGIAYTSSSDGIVVGNNGVILKTTNAGSNWTTVPGGVTDNLKKVSFPAATTGYIAGWGGTVLRTDNGGSDWTRQSTGSTTILYDIDFVSVNVGTAVGYSGTILRTTNGGSSWSPQSSGTVESLYGVDFVDQNTGFIVGSTGVILRTTNGGSTWTRLSPGTFQNLNGVSFVNQSTGVVVGGAETILRTTDGGSTWASASVGPVPPAANVIVRSVPDGRTFLVDGVTYTGSASFSWTPSSSHTLSVASPQGDAATRYLFAGWSDGGAQSHTVSPANDTTFTVSFTTQHYLTVRAGSANGSVSPPGGWYNQGQAVTITATPYSGYTFAGWAGTGPGSYTGMNNPAGVTVNGPVTETASFSVTMVPVTVSSDPPGRAVIVDGTVYTAPRTFNWPAGSVHTLSSDSLQNGASPDGRFRWISWSDGGSRNHNVTATSPATYTAAFRSQFLLTMQTGPGGTVSPPGSWYDTASSVAITATPAPGYSFAGWTGTGPGSYSGPANPAGVTMRGPVTETAGFTLAPVTVTVRSSPPGRTFLVDGVTYTGSASFSWTPSSSHALSVASPQGDTATRYLFSGWSDGGAQNHTVAPMTDTTFTVSFFVQYYLTMRRGAGEGSVSPSNGWYDAGDIVEIAATPAASYAFFRWTGTGTGSYSGPNNPATVTMGGPLTETADFAPGLVTVTVTTSPPGLGVIVDGSSYTSPRSFDWTAGSTHTISTDSLQNAVQAGTRYRWNSWSDGGARTHSVNPVSAATYTASFGTQYLLTVAAGAGGTVTPPTGWYTAGRSVQVAALPDSGYEFLQWTGAGSGSYSGPDNPATVTVPGPVTQTAEFAPRVVSPPAVTTAAAGSIASRSAVINGAVNPQGDPTTAWFEWGTDSALASVATTPPQPVGSGTAAIAFDEGLTSLVPDTRYFFRAVAENGGGTEKGGILSFTTDTVVLSGPEFGITGSEIDFGPVLIGASGTDSVTILNLGDAPLSVSGIVSTSPLYVPSASSVNVPPGGSRPITVTFTPDAKATEDAWLVFTHDGPGSPDSVRLSGSGYTGGVPVVNPRSLTFSYVGSVGPQTREFYLRNEGDRPFTVDTILSTNGSYLAELSGTLVEPGDSQQVSVTCDPDTTGPREGLIILRYQGPWEPDSVSVTYDIVLDARPEGEIPREVTLSQNYPNPFNPQTRIVFTLPDRARVTLRVFNTLGEEVAVLRAGPQTPGTHEVPFDAAGSPSGVYLCRLEAVTERGEVIIRTVKMLLVR